MSRKQCSARSDGGSTSRCASCRPEKCGTLSGRFAASLFVLDPKHIGITGPQRDHGTPTGPRLKLLPRPLDKKKNSGVNASATPSRAGSLFREKAGEKICPQDLVAFLQLAHEVGSAPRIPFSSHPAKVNSMPIEIDPKTLHHPRARTPAQGPRCSPTAPVLASSLIRAPLIQDGGRPPGGPPGIPWYSFVVRCAPPHISARTPSAIPASPRPRLEWLRSPS